MSKITLDAETFKALASSTRLTVLKALDERRKTLTELAHELQLNKATVHEHLGLLLASGLVKKRDDEGRKWIYYELTWTGQRILRPEATTTFNVLLGLSALAAGGGVFALGRALDWWMADGNQDNPEGGAERSGTPSADEDRQALFATEAPPPSDDGGSFLDDGGWIAIALAAAFLVFCALAVFLYWRLSPKPLDEESAARAETRALA